MKKNNQIWIYILVLFGVFSIFTSSCKKSDEEGLVTDIDGNNYHTVVIGTQEWMVENLKTTKFNDGISIPNIINNSDWANQSNPGYCWYNNDVGNKNPYGALYNWYAIEIQKLAPKGWHIPTDAEWDILITFLGGTEVAGGKLKEAGLSHWLSPNTGSTNQSGFTAVPGGIRNWQGIFDYIGNECVWWSSDVSHYNGVWDRRLDNGSNNVGSWRTNPVIGLSVRCIKD